MSKNYKTSTMKITGELYKNTKGRKILPLSEIQRMQQAAFGENKNNQNQLQITGKSIVNSINQKQYLKGIKKYNPKLYVFSNTKNYPKQEPKNGQTR